MTAARSQVGGAWIYSSETPGTCKILYDKHGRPFSVRDEEQTFLGSDSSTHANGATISSGSSSSNSVLDPSPMYRLRTNIPADLMAYRGYPFTHISGPFPRVIACSSPLFLN